MMKIIEERQGPTLTVVLKSVALVGEKIRSPSRTDGLLRKCNLFPMGVFEILHTGLHKSGEFVCGYWAFKISPLLVSIFQ